MEKKKRKEAEGERGSGAACGGGHMREEDGVGRSGEVRKGRGARYKGEKKKERGKKEAKKEGRRAR